VAERKQLPANITIITGNVRMLTSAQWTLSKNIKKRDFPNPGAKSKSTTRSQKSQKTKKTKHRPNKPRPTHRQEVAGKRKKMAGRKKEIKEKAVEGVNIGLVSNWGLGVLKSLLVGVDWIGRGDEVTKRKGGTVRHRRSFFFYRWLKVALVSHPRES